MAKFWSRADQDRRRVLRRYRRLINKTSDIGVIRLNANGTIDKTFGHRGEVILSFRSNAKNSDRLAAMAVDPVGRIVLAGTVNRTTNRPKSSWLGSTPMAATTHRSARGDDRTRISQPGIHRRGCRRDGHRPIGPNHRGRDPDTAERPERIRCDPAKDEGLAGPDLRRPRAVSTNSSRRRTSTTTRFECRPGRPGEYSGCRIGEGDRLQLFAVTRIRSDGSADPTFGYQGVAILPTDQNFDAGPKIAVEFSGPDLAGGYVQCRVAVATSTILTARLTTDRTA